MKKNIHNVGGFVAFSGATPEIINLVTQEIVPIMRTLKHPIDVTVPPDAKVERNKNGAFMEECVFTCETPFPFSSYAENLMYAVIQRLIETGREDVIRTLEDNCFSFGFEYTNYNSFTEEMSREIVGLFKNVGKPIEVEHLVLSEEGNENIDHWRQRELLMADD